MRLHTIRLILSAKVLQQTLSGGRLVMVGLVLGLTLDQLIQMIASILIIVFSAVLLVYWFRYSCLLLLRNATEQPDASPLVGERFSIDNVLATVRTEPHLENLEQCLNRDYDVLSYLLKHAADLELASIENRMLILDYQLMRIWYRLTRIVAPNQSRKALEEMASVLGAVARQAGQPSEEVA